MIKQDNNVLAKNTNDDLSKSDSLVKALADAKKQIQELEMKLMWMERNYE